MACRDCCPLHVGTEARTGLGKGRRRRGNTWGKMEGGREEIGCSGEKEEKQEDSKGCSENSHPGARARSRAGELVVGIYNVRTLAFKGTNGIGHAEVILNTCENAGCDIIGLQEVRRDGQSALTAAGYVLFCSEADGGKPEIKD